MTAETSSPEAQEPPQSELDETGAKNKTGKVKFEETEQLSSKCDDVEDGKARPKPEKAGKNRKRKTEKSVTEKTDKVCLFIVNRWFVSPHHSLADGFLIIKASTPKFTPEETALVFKLHDELNGDWKNISVAFNVARGRTAKQLEKHWKNQKYKKNKKGKNSQSLNGQ